MCVMEMHNGNCMVEIHNANYKVEIVELKLQVWMHNGNAQCIMEIHNAQWKLHSRMHMQFICNWIYVIYDMFYYNVKW
jgi:hypothetical protein